MKSTGLTFVLLILVILAAMWTSGRLQRVLNVVFGK